MAALTPSEQADLFSQIDQLAAVLRAERFNTANQNSYARLLKVRAYVERLTSVPAPEPQKQRRGIKMF